MPELPEVETIARYLRQGDQTTAPGGGGAIIGMRVSAADVLWPRTIASPPAEEFKVRIIGQTIEDVGRRAKYLVIQLTQDNLLIHLRMSGDIQIQPIQQPPARHDRLVLALNKPGPGTNPVRKLVFNDTRKFGRVWLLKETASILGKLGPEPLSDTLTPEWLYASLQSRRRQLKPLLMDQSFIAGLGNIYTDEALHRARLHPRTLANSLSEEQAVILWRTLREVLLEGIENNGSSIDWVYRGGGFQNHFRVYGRAGKPCPRCGAQIERIVVGQRGTHICPNCQPLVQDDDGNPIANFSN